MTILTILNTLAIIYLIMSVKSRYYITLEKEQTSWCKTLLGYRVTLWEKTSEHSANGLYSIYVPIKNREKAELKDEIQQLMAYNEHHRRQTLNAKFSWLKTWEEVWQFEKDYSIVDSEYIKKLVSNFIPK